MRQREKAGGGTLSSSNPICLGIVVFIVLAVVGCIVFASLQMTVGAIVTGVIGLLFIIALVVIVAVTRGNRPLV